MTNWIKLLNRECSLAFQAEVPLVNRDLLPKVIGMSINNFWCENITFGVYYQSLELKGLAEAIQSNIVADPTFAKRNISDCYRLGDMLLNNAKMPGPDTLVNNTNAQLVQELEKFLLAYRNFLPYLVFPHSIERYFMEIISQALKKQLASSQNEGEFNRIYEICTTPANLEIEEQVNLLTLSKKMKREGFTKKNLQLIDTLKDKYAWQPLFSLTAKPLTRKYFEDAIRAYVDGNTHLDAEIRSLQQGQKDRIRKLNQTLKEMKATRTLRSYVELLQGYMYLRTYRKNIIAKAHFLHVPLVTEIGNRMRIKEDFILATYEEMIAYLRSGDTVSENVIKRRKDAWAVVSINGNVSIVSGKKGVDATAKKYAIEDVQKEISEKIVRGQPACLGKVIGKVRIVKNSNEFDTVQQDDVLVTPMTTPDFVPLLQKVSAIITDEGGVTCHAAIISREYQVPCIVGTGNATKVFTNGDLIEVDANHGIATIIK